MAAPAFESFATAQATAAAGVTVAAPSGSVEGDHWLAIITTHEALQTHDTPSGWTLLQSSTSSHSAQRTSLFSRMVPASPGSTEFTFGGNCDSTAVIARSSGVDAATPVDVSAVDASTVNSNPAVAPTVTTTVADTLVYRAVGGNNITSVTTPATERWVELAAVGVVRANAGSSATQASAGATGTADFTLNNTRPWVAFTVALAPAAAGGAVTGTITADINAIGSSATATYGPTGSIAADVNAIGSSATGIVEVTGSIATDINAIGTSAEGTFTDGSVTGTIATDINAIASSATGAVEVTGTAVADITAIGTSATGAYGPSGTIAADINAIGTAATGAAEVSGTLTADITAIGTSATGTGGEAGGAVETRRGGAPGARRRRRVMLDGRVYEVRSIVEERQLLEQYIERRQAEIVGGDLPSPAVRAARISVRKAQSRLSATDARLSRLRALDEEILIIFAAAA